MNIEQVREYTLSLPGVTEDQPFGDDNITFRLEGKIFMCLWLGSDNQDIKDDEPRLALKLSPDRNEELREKFPSVTPAWHWNKKHWNDVYYDQLDDSLVMEWIKESYHLVASKLPKKVRQKYVAHLSVPLHSDMQKQKKILFLHGFYASGSCVPALALREAFEKRATVLTPDLPLHPADAVRMIRDICDQEKPDVLVGNSCGSFYAQMIAPVIGVPALLGNPHFKMSDFLRERIGSHQYKSPRANGKQDFTIDEQLISEFEEMEKHQFDCCNNYNKERVWGLFGEEDTLAHFEPLFLQYYSHSFHFPGGHTPTAEEVHQYYVPLILRLREAKK